MMWQYYFQLLLVSVMLIANMLVTQSQQALPLCPGGSSVASCEWLVARVRVSLIDGEKAEAVTLWHIMGSCSPLFFLCWGHILAPGL